jgi:hypothetical protein
MASTHLVIDLEPGVAHVGTALRRPNVEMQEAAERVMAAMDKLHGDTSLYAQFKTLSERGMFRFDRLGRSRTLAWALWYCRSQAKAAAAMPERKVPQALIDTGTSVRARMHRVMKHHLEFDAKDGPAVLSVTLGNDHRQLANHLQLLSEVAARHAELLATDRQWNSDAPKSAHDLARDISLALGGGDAVDWDGRSAALYMMLQEAYGDVLVTGRWILREQPAEGARRFPKLVPYRGGGRGASADDGATEEADDEAEGEVEGADDAQEPEDVVEGEAAANDAPSADAAKPAEEPAAKTPARKAPVKKAKEPAATPPAKKAGGGGR